MTVAMVDQDVIGRWRSLPFARHGVCSGCGRSHDYEGRPLYLRGRRWSNLVCLSCFSRWPLRRQVG